MVSVSIAQKYIVLIQSISLVIACTVHALTVYEDPHISCFLSLLSLQYVIKASSAGVVEKVLFTPGQSVAKNASLVKLKELEE